MRSTSTFPLCYSKLYMILPTYILMTMVYDHTYIHIYILHTDVRVLFYLLVKNENLNILLKYHIHV